MRIDSHQHFWRFDPDQLPWITDRMAGLRRDYLPPDLLPLLDADGFDGSIAVQARQTIEETSFLLEQAEQEPRIFGVVGWLDLCSPGLEAQLERFSSHPKLVGARHIVHDEPDDDFMRRPDFRRGVGRLVEHELTYDLLLRPRHLPAAVDLVDEFEDLLFVLDHIAKPAMPGPVASEWRQGIESLAERPNVFCKLSGLVTEADWRGWRDSDFRPCLDAVLEAFGARRLMIGSDWPVCTLAADYATAMGVVTGYVGALSADEQAGILGDNCARFYAVRRARRG